MCKTGDTCRDVDRDPLRIAARQLYLTCVQSGSHFETERAHCIHDSARTPNRACRPVKRRHKPITERLEFLSSETGQLSSYDRIVLCQ